MRRNVMGIGSIGKLIGIYALTKKFSHTSKLSDHMSNITILLGLIIFLAMMVGALVLLGLYGFYVLMLYYNVDETIAVSIAVALLLTIIVLSGYSAVSYLRKAFSISELLNPVNNALPTPLPGIVGAFMDGLLNKNTQNGTR